MRRLITYLAQLAIALQFSCLGLAAAEHQVDHVIHISVDGLRASAIEELGAAQLPNLYRIQQAGAYTNNARTLREVTVTMPNHVSMLTGRPRDGLMGHNVSRNSDPFDPQITVHSDKGAYVTSVFDVVHDQGRSTALYAGWNGFNFIDNSWNAATGRPDTIGVDNGTDKIDTYHLRTDDNLSLQVSELLEDLSTDPYAYTLLHLHRTDAQGHAWGWASSQYLTAVRETDLQIGRIMAFVEQNRGMANNTAVIVTSDHGGAGFGHGDINNIDTYRVPLYVWIPETQLGGELYAANSLTRRDPGTSAPDYAEPISPIRTGEIANLALDLLGLGAVPGSTLNANQDLQVEFDLSVAEGQFLVVDPQSGVVQLRNQTTVPVTFDGYAIQSASGSLRSSAWNSINELTGAANWRKSNVSSEQLAELLPSGVFTLAAGETLRFGAVFDAALGSRDLEFELLRASETLGSDVPVVYAAILPNGDFNSDGQVNAADFTLWRDSMGSKTQHAADGDGDGVIAAADFVIWSAQFNALAGTVASSVAVPEPSVNWCQAVVMWWMSRCLRASGPSAQSKRPR